jgi:hypothetical protein
MMTPLNASVSRSFASLMWQKHAPRLSNGSLQNIFATLPLNASRPIGHQGLTETVPASLLGPHSHNDSRSIFPWNAKATTAIFFRTS